MSDGLERAREELDAARLLTDNDFGGAAVSRAYYAAFYAAEAALAVLGETRSKHSGVISAFGKLVVKEGGLDPAAGRYLRSLFEQRGRADYSDAPTAADDARGALADATRFLDAVEAWLAARG